MKDDQRGYIVVETLGAFMLFVFFVTSILSLINIVVVQARVHNAVTQAALAISMYDYSFSAAGYDDDVMKIAGRADEVETEINTFKTNVNVVLDGLNSLSGSNSMSQDITTAKNIYNSGSAVVDQTTGWVESAVNDPKDMIGKLLSFGATELSEMAFGAMVRPIIGRYLTNGSQSGDEYLISMNVIDGLEGLDIVDSTFLDKNGDVVIRVQYEIEYRFGNLKLPFEPKLAVEHMVKTKAWLGGAGEGFSSGS